MRINRTKKLASILLALVMAIAMAVPAFATSGTNDQADGKITITGAHVGHKYTIYKMFDLESYSNVTANGGNYSYKVTAAWAPFFAESAPGAAYLTVDTDGYVTNRVENLDAAEFAKAALAWAEEHNIANQGQQTATAPAVGEGEEVPATTTVVFENLELGYYLVDSSAGALCGLNTTDREVNIAEKNTNVPTVDDKEVLENSIGDYSHENDANIGDTVTFQVTINAKPGAENYVLHDTMSAGLTFTGVSGVTANNVPLTADTDYTVVTKEEVDGSCTFEVVFEKTYLDTITADTTIVVTYTATVNENAMIGGTTGNTNDARLQYGDGTYTESKGTKTFVWELPIYKFTMVNEEKTPLADAKFILYREVAATGTEPAKNEYAQFTNGKLSGWTETKAQATELTSGDNGMINVSGLDSGTYKLEETQAPKGYNKLTAPVTVVIGSDGKIGTGEGAATATQYEVENNSGTELPETGGIGTTIFYTLGGIMAAGAVILLVTKKRMSSK